MFNQVNRDNPTQDLFNLDKLVRTEITKFNLASPVNQDNLAKPETVGSRDNLAKPETVDSLDNPAKLETVANLDSRVMAASNVCLTLLNAKSVDK